MILQNGNGQELMQLNYTSKPIEIVTQSNKIISKTTQEDKKTKSSFLSRWS